MNLLKYSILQSTPIFTTRDYGIQCGISTSSASRLLTKIEKGKDIIRVTRGLWMRGNALDIHPFSLSPYLLGNENGYISLLTALHYHGLLSQIPARIQIVTTGHSRILKTPMGVYEFFQLKPGFMKNGVIWSETDFPYRMASPEKALLDTLYLSTRKGNRFSSLPEINFEKTKFQKKGFLTLLKNQNFPPPIHQAIVNRFDILYLKMG